MREREKKDAEVYLVSVTILTDAGEEERFPAVVSGRRLQILVDEFPLQSWLREHSKEVLQAVCEAEHEVTELRIYEDSYK